LLIEPLEKLIDKFKVDIKDPEKIKFAQIPENAEWLKQ